MAQTTFSMRGSSNATSCLFTQRRPAPLGRPVAVAFLVLAAAIPVPGAAQPYIKKETLPLEQRVHNCIEALRKDYPKVRYEAIKELAELGAKLQAFPAVVPAVREALGDKEVLVREKAAEILGTIRCTNAVPALMEALRDEGVRVRAAAAQALGKLGPEAKDAIPRLQKALRDKDELVRAGAGEALVAIDPEAARAALPELLDLLRSANSGAAQVIAIRALGAIGAKLKDTLPQILPPLRKLLGPHGRFVHPGAATALGKIGPAAKEAVPELLQAAAMGEPAAAKALLQIDPDAATRAVPDLVKALSDKDEETRYGATVTLAALGPAAKEAAPALLAKLTEKDRYQVIENAALALRSMGNQPVIQEAIQNFMKALKDPDPLVRGRSAGCLQLLHATQAVDALTALLKDGDRRVQKCAAYALVGIDAAAAKRLVADFADDLRDKDVAVRRTAADILGCFAAVEPDLVGLLPGVRRALKDEDAAVRLKAAEALGAFSSDTSEAVAALKEALKDKDAQVRKAAGASLKKLDPAAAKKEGIR